MKGIYGVVLFSILLLFPLGVPSLKGVSVEARDSTVIQPNPADMLDTYISSISPTLNFGINNTLKVNGTQPEKALLKFPISMPSGSVILSATLKLYCYYAENQAETVSISAYKVLRSWEEGSGNGTQVPGANWYVRDPSNSWQSPGMAPDTDYDSTPIDTKNVNSASIWYSWNITSVFREWVYGTATNYGLVLMTNWGSAKYFYSSDCGNQQYWPKIEVSYIIDTTPPVTTATVIGTQGANGWYIDAVTVNLSATDTGIGVDKIWYRINSGPWQEYSGNILLSNEGVYNITYYAVDKVGNTETQKSTIVKIDLAEPITNHYLTGTSGNNNWYISPVTLTLRYDDSASGVNKTYYKLNTSFQWLVYTAPINFSNDGYYTVDYYSTDFAGRSETPKSVSFKIDKTAPKTSLIPTTGTMGENGWYISPVQVKISATDNLSGVHETYYRLNSSQDWMLYTQEFVISEEGIYNLEYYSVDEAGNIEAWASKEIKIDLTQPEANITISGNLTQSGWYNTNVTVTINASDLSGIAEIKYRIDGGNWENYTSPIKITSGNHTFEYEVKNGAGLKIENTTQIMVDTQKPVSGHRIIGNLGAYNWYVTSVFVNLSASDDVSGIAEIAYRFPDQDWQVYTNEIYLGVEGVSVIEYRAVDVAGNIEDVKSITIKIDYTPPTTQFNLSGKNGSNDWFTGRVTLTLNAEDYTSGVSETFYKVGETGDWVRYSSPLTFDDGTYVIFFYSLDSARNKESVKNVSFKIDSVAPDIRHSQITEWLYSEEIPVSVTISEYGSGVADVRLYYKNPGWATYRDIRMTTSDGKTYTAVIPKDDVTLDGIEYYIEAKDFAGNSVRLPAGGSAYFITTHINYYYLLLLIPLILVILFVVLKYLGYWEDFLALFKPKKKEVEKEEPKVPETVRCASCNYPIPHEVVNQAFVCHNCGAVLHPACASRLTTCPRCGTSIR